MSAPSVIPWERFGSRLRLRGGDPALGDHWWVARKWPWRLEARRKVTAYDGRVSWCAEVCYGRRFVASVNVAVDRPEMAIRKADKALDELQSAIEALKRKP